MRGINAEKPPPRLEIQEQKRAPQKLTEKPQRDAMTPREWVPYLRGKSQEQTIALLGKPDRTWEEDMEWEWFYRGLTPQSGIRKSLVVMWSSNSTIYSIKVGHTGKPIFLGR